MLEQPKERCQVCIRVLYICKPRQLLGVIVINVDDMIVQVNAELNLSNR